MQSSLDEKRFPNNFISIINIAKPAVREQTKSTGIMEKAKLVRTLSHGGVSVPWAGPFFGFVPGHDSVVL
jgi:hypothetical protein